MFRVVISKFENRDFDCSFLDMRELEKDYVEMTTGYKEFIRDVLKANRLREETRNNTSPIEGF